MEGNEGSNAFRAGFVTLIGAPNAGKSTLLNHVLGRRLAIVTPKPQTTRHRILGIHNTADAQFLFVDTPGVHRASNLMGKRMVQVAKQSLADADVGMWVVDVGRSLTEDDRRLARDLAQETRPIVVAANKVDLRKRAELLPLIEELAALVPGRDIVPVSAKSGDNVPELLATVRGFLPESPALYPPDAETDLSERFFAAEMVRKQVLLETHQEVPYESAVEVVSFEERPGKDLVAIEAEIRVARSTQKGIVIGDKGSRLKTIGQKARLELERFFGVRIFLQLFVKVDPKWFTRPGRLTELGL